MYISREARGLRRDCDVENSGLRKKCQGESQMMELYKCYSRSVGRCPGLNKTSLIGDWSIFTALVDLPTSIFTTHYSQRTNNKLE